MNDLEKFYKMIKVDGAYNCVNYMNKGKFSRNQFINSYEELFKFGKDNKDKDCYINYQPLLKPINRKTENILGVNLITLDIEFAEKRVPESKERLNELKEYIHRLISIEHIHKYMLVNSGNGYHLYIPFKKIITKKKYDIKEAYKIAVKYLNFKLSEISEGLVKADDRKDLAGILRIPFTTNTKANKIVVVEEYINKTQNNDSIYKYFRLCLYKAKKQKDKFKENEKKQKDKFKDIKIPKNIDELIDHPLVKFLFDKKIPASVKGSRHTSVIFALQALIYHSGLSHEYDILILSREINRTCGISVDLSSCSNVDNLIFPINAAIKYFRDNKYDSYKDELCEMYKINEIKEK